MRGLAGELPTICKQEGRQKAQSVFRGEETAAEGKIIPLFVSPNQHDTTLM